jgi:NAD(P)-dependent dehydrogenase (short-subunit alcohol dehydrogenase family)
MTALVRPFDLSGHAAILTGGNSGIGFGMATGLVKAGAAVAILGRDLERSRDAAEQLGALGGTAYAVHCDVGDEMSVKEAFAEAIGRLGRLDSCFANAGSMHRQAFIETSLHDWQAATRVDLDGLFLTLREAATLMIRQNEGGSLVVTSSIAAMSGQPNGAGYAASKAAGLAICRSLAVELARYRIRVNAIVPGWVTTPLTDSLLGGEQFAESVLRRVPVRRWGRPDDFEALAVYLASPHLLYHTGDALIVDGGYLLF